MAKTRSARDAERLRDVGDRIRDAVETRGLSLSRLAIMAGIPLSTLNTYVSDEPAEIGAVNLARVAIALGVSIDELVLDVNEAVAISDKHAGAA